MPELADARRAQLDAICSPAVVLNPRRERYPAGQAEAAREQIAWEYEHLRIADVILFWFCADAIQSIALYELGAHAARGTRLAVGARPQVPAPPGCGGTTAPRTPGRDCPRLSSRHRPRSRGPSAHGTHHGALTTPSTYRGEDVRRLDLDRLPTSRLKDTGQGLRTVRSGQPNGVSRRNRFARLTSP
ncbi:nucleoside 2-deoxyribosyltransferase domain-containing protein [Streptomyces sp. NPDC002550]